MASASKSFLNARTRSSSAVLDPAVFFLLLEIGFFVGAVPIAEALLGRPRRVGSQVAILAVRARVMRLGPEVDLVFVAVIAEEQRLAAIGDQNQRIVGKGHERLLVLAKGERDPTQPGCYRSSQLSPCWAR